MNAKIGLASRGLHPFDLLITNIRLVNVMTLETYEASIGIVDGDIAYAGPPISEHRAKETLDGGGMYAAPGFIDSHMHLESSMMTPAHFAQAILPLGTTSVCADPHEIANVLGEEGVALLSLACEKLPLTVHLMAPSTVPSAPGFETSGADVDAEAVRRMLALPGVLGLGEVMDFNGVAAGDDRMLAICRAAREAGVPLDGHVPALHGADLQAFAAPGIDCDHTYMDPETVLEKLRLGMCVQIQERFLTRELMETLNRLNVQNRVMLVTDDVPLTRLCAEGHLNSVMRKAMALGLRPLLCYRYVTINAADRLRQYSVGAIAPGRRADIVLLPDLLDVQPSVVLCAGRVVARSGHMTVDVPQTRFPDSAYRTMRLSPLTPSDFAIRASIQEGRARVRLIAQDGKTSRTVLEEGDVPVRGGVLQNGPYAKMAVFCRHGQGSRSLGFLSHMEGFRGALGTTYAHDCHNLTVYGSNDADMLLCANALIEAGGGVCAVKDGQVLCLIPLPIAGLLCEEDLPTLAPRLQAFLSAVRQTGLPHEEALTFMTLMPLAVSPCVKLTDKGLVDVLKKEMLPLIVSEEEM